MDERLLVDFFSEEKKHWWHVAKRKLIKQFIYGENLSILVAGLGGGIICDELKAAGHRVIGMDISPLSCEYVNKKIRMPVIRADLEKPLPFAKKSFDVVIIADVLEHLNNDNQLLEEVSLCLKFNGIAVITVPAYMHMWSAWDMRLNHKRRYSLAMIKKGAVEVGLKVKKASYYHMLLYPFVYIYRVMLGLPKGKCSEKSDFSVFPIRLFSDLFAFCYALERFLLKITDLPFGLSIFVIGKKHG